MNLEIEINDEIVNNLIPFSLEYFLGIPHDEIKVHDYLKDLLSDDEEEDEDNY